MGKYSIKELEKLSGIKAHTLRIWEKRYNIFSPDRTDTNIRTYSDWELKKLLNISILNQHGLKISKIAHLSDQEMSDQVFNLSGEDNSDLNIHIDQLTIAMVELNEVKFEKLLSNFILRFGFEKTILKIMYPFLDKIGVLWLSSNISPIQEHFISNLIRQKIIVAIDGLETTQNTNAAKAVLFLPENELHEIGLLFYHYLVKSYGLKTYYLGQYVPLEDLQNVTTNLQPQYLITSITQLPTDLSIEEYITQLVQKFPKYRLVVSGRAINNYNSSTPENVSLVKSVSEFKSIFSSNY